MLDTNIFRPRILAVLLLLFGGGCQDAGGGPPRSGPPGGGPPGGGSPPATDLQPNARPLDDDVRLTEIGQGVFEVADLDVQVGDVLISRVGTGRLLHVDSILGRDAGVTRFAGHPAELDEAFRSFSIEVEDVLREDTVVEVVPRMPGVTLKPSSEPSSSGQWRPAFDLDLKLSDHLSLKGEVAASIDWKWAHQYSWYDADDRFARLHADWDLSGQFGAVISAGLAIDRTYVLADIVGPAIPAGWLVIQPHFELIVQVEANVNGKANLPFVFDGVAESNFEWTPANGLSRDGSLELTRMEFDPSVSADAEFRLFFGGRMSLYFYGSVGPSVAVGLGMDESIAASWGGACAIEATQEYGLDMIIGINTSSFWQRFFPWEAGGTVRLHQFPIERICVPPRGVSLEIEGMTYFYPLAPSQVSWDLNEDAVTMAFAAGFPPDLIRFGFLGVGGVRGPGAYDNLVLAQVDPLLGYEAFGEGGAQSVMNVQRVVVTNGVVRAIDADFSGECRLKGWTPRGVLSNSVVPYTGEIHYH